MTKSKISDHQRPVLKLEPEVAEKVKDKIRDMAGNELQKTKSKSNVTSKMNKTISRKKRIQFKKSKIRNKQKKQNARVNKIIKEYCALAKIPKQKEVVSKLRRFPEFSRISELELRRVADLSVGTIAKRIAQIARQIEKARKEEGNRTAKRQRIRMKVFAVQRKILDRKTDSRVSSVRVSKAQGSEEESTKISSKKTKIPKIKSSDAMHRAILSGFETNRRRH